MLRRNESLSFVCRDVPARRRAHGHGVYLTLRRGERLTIPVKHGEGCWFADDALYDELEANRQIVLRYAEPVKRLSE